MRFVPTILLCLTMLPGAFGQKALSDKPTRTAFSIRAVDDKTSAELPAQFTIQARLAKKKFTGQSQPGQSFDFVLTLPIHSTWWLRHRATAKPKN